MGLLDKVKATAATATVAAKDAAAKGQAKLDEAQAKKAADGMLRDLGAAFYATKTGRATPTTDADIERLVAALQAHESEHGPITLAPESAAAAPTAAPAGGRRRRPRRPPRQRTRRHHHPRPRQRRRCRRRPRRSGAGPRARPSPCVGARGAACRMTLFAAGWSSLVARRAHNPKVGGSNPPPATNESAGQSRSGGPALLAHRILEGSRPLTRIFCCPAENPHGRPYRSRMRGADARGTNYGS